MSYNRFVALMPEVLFVFSVYLYTRLGTCDGVSFMDSTRLRVCENRRIPTHRVFAEEAERGKTLSSKRPKQTKKGQAKRFMSVTRPAALLHNIKNGGISHTVPAFVTSAAVTTSSRIGSHPTPHAASFRNAHKPLAWKEGNIIFQLSTGRYSPAQSLIEGDKEQNHKAIALRPRGKELLQIITTEAEKGKPTLVVGPKDFTEEADLKHLPEIANLLAMPNVHVINHHHAEGVNQYDHCENAFIFLYEPRPDELKKIASRKLETSRKQSDMPPTDRFKDIGFPKLLVVINHVGAEYICFVFV